MLTRKISIGGLWNPKAFVPHTTEYFPSSCNARPCCVVGDKDCLHNHCLCHTVGYSCWACACVQSVVCGENPPCIVDLWEGGTPCLTLAIYVCGVGNIHRRGCSRHFPPICTVPIQDQTAPALLPQRSSFLLLILSPSFLVSP